MSDDIGQSAPTSSLELNLADVDLLEAVNAELKYRENVLHKILHHLSYRNLKESGLSDDYIVKMQVKSARNAHYPADYVIPYFDKNGVMIPNFSRQRIFRSSKESAKYLQQKDTSNHLYLPPTFAKDLRGSEFVVITEGEKKAASLAQYGIPCVGLGGVDSWRTKRVELPIENLVKDPASGQVFLNIDDDLDFSVSMTVAHEFPQLLEMIGTKRRVLIIFDSDYHINLVTNRRQAIQDNVQRAAFDLACFLFEQGLEKIQMPILPSFGEEEGKVGLDDFVKKVGPDLIKEWLSSGLFKFPTRPKVKTWINKELNKPRVTRSNYQKIARAIVAHLDQIGTRYQDEQNNFYYFDSRSKVFYIFRLEASEVRNLRLNDFGAFLFSEFGISSNDTSLISHIVDAFIGLIGSQHIVPHKVFYAHEKPLVDKEGVVTGKENTLYYQLDDISYVRVTSTEITFHDNGDNGIVFIAGGVEPLDKLALATSIQKYSSSVELRNKWVEALSKTQIRPLTGLSEHETHLYLSCLFYINPWLRLWKGTMMPLELFIAEPNSGKSMLMNLRKTILTGRPQLEQMPQNIKDFYASVTNTPGLWVADNVGSLPQAMYQTLPDELSRLITDPKPSISQRRYYTTSDNQVEPVNCSFTITAINNPFVKEDLLQRSIVVNMTAIPMGERDGNWYRRQVDSGGREDWIANQLQVTKQFFTKVEEQWSNDYMSGHRLVNFEQSIKLMLEVLSPETKISLKVIDNMSRITQNTILDNSVVLQALKEFAAVWYAKANELVPPQPKKPFTASDIHNWIITSEEFSDIKVLDNPRLIGKYIQSHAYDVKTTCHIEFFKILGNKNTYVITKPL